MTCRPTPSMAGFTLFELIAVMVLIGILAFVAIPRFADRTFDERGFHDAAMAAVQHARRTAVASRRFVCVNATAGTGAAAVLELRMDTTAPESVATVACTAAIALPAPGRGCAATNQVCAPNGVSLGGSGLIFDPLGRSVNSSKIVLAAAVSLTISNQPDITIQPETGYVQ